MSTTEVAAFKAMQTDIQISMDDVVSAFVSQYENNLYTRKKQLTSEIRAAEETAAKFVKAARKKINGASFKTPLPFGLEMTVADGTFDWNQAEANFIITIEPKNNGRYGNSLSVTKTKSIPATQVKAYEGLQKELESLRSALGEVLVSLKSVTRKERQVRGRIAIRKLEDSGYANLMQDDELVKLVELDD